MDDEFVSSPPKSAKVNKADKVEMISPGGTQQSFYKPNDDA